MDAYIYCWPIFFINKFINCQNVGKKHFSLYYLEDALTRSLFLLLSFLLKDFNLYSWQKLVTFPILYCSKQFES